jgi:ubiquinone/menaquinone biosynthesis C-methylase UbiE
MNDFIWKQAQENELEWWERWESKDKAVLGKGGTSRYPLYLEVFAKHFSSESILDVGGGAYPLVNWIPCKRRVALDPLNSRFAQKGFSRNSCVEYLDGMAENLPFEDNSFEQVLLLNMLDHLDDWRRAVCEALRVASQSVLVHVHIDGRSRLTGCTV